MTISYRRRFLEAINWVLAPTGVELIRKNKGFQDYIPLKKTLADAQQAGLSIGDYIDLRFNVPGVTLKTIEQMAELSVFSNKIERVCEIGPGSGRYLEKVIEIVHPEYYEIYETSKDWREWLVKTHKVVSQPTDGASLSSTPSMSVDLVHSHKVLYGNPVITKVRYLLEMVRVVRKNGFVVFDLVTEECLTDEILQKWIASGVDHACTMTSKKYTIDFFINRGFTYLGGFIVPMEPGVTEYFVFKKQA